MPTCMCVNKSVCVCMRELAVDAGHSLVKCARAELAICVWPVCVCAHVHVCGRAWLLALVSCSPFGWTTTTTAEEQHTHAHTHCHPVTVCVLISRAHRVYAQLHLSGSNLLFWHCECQPASFSHSHHLFNTLHPSSLQIKSVFSAKQSDSQSRITYVILMISGSSLDIYFLTCSTRYEDKTTRPLMVFKKWLLHFEEPNTVI